MLMNVLIFNCGSSSQGFKVYRAGVGRPALVLIAGKARNVATKTQASAYLEWEREGKSEKRGSTCRRTCGRQRRSSWS